jgi:hypothetical protein
MALKLAFPMPDKAGLQTAGAKLRAWWNGEPYEPPALEVIEGGAGGEGEGASAPKGPASPGGPPKLWQPGRTDPMDAVFDRSIATAAGAQKSTPVTLIGGGGPARALSIAQEFGCKVEVWHADLAAKAACEAAFKTGMGLVTEKIARRCTVATFDWTAGSLPKGKAQALVIPFELTGADRLAAIAAIGARMLKPGGCGVLVDLVARVDDDMLDPSRGEEKRRFVTEEAVERALEDAGLMVRGVEDMGAPFLDAMHRAWGVARADMDTRLAAAMTEGGVENARAALGELLTWKARATAVKSGRLTLRRFTFGFVR